MKETVLHEIGFHPRAIFLWTNSKLSFDIFKMKKVTSQYLLCITIIRLENVKILKISEWHYIPSEQNPADLCTRTQIDFKLIQQKWFYGPENIR